MSRLLELMLYWWQIVGGDCSQGNLWLCREMVNLFMDKWDTLLDEEPLVLTSALYVFLWLLADHYMIRIDPKIEDLVLNPSEFKTDGFIDVSQLYHARTSSKYFLLRITPAMELHMRFLLTHVKLGSQKRHQMWFARKHLSVPERGTLIIDIVRFICCGHHPRNEIIQSNIIPRWAVIGWLLTICRKKYIEANVKLALFYDWLFFDDKVDNIMNIEPAILLMVNSIPKYIDITHVLHDFLIYLLENYDLDRKDSISKGVATAIRSLVNSGVFESVGVLTRCEMLTPSLRERTERLLVT
ncbi:hypothetical protein LIER_11881 [Lithospermum erythrorhizon]|uniref:Integrator complex subunit 3 N-terminal domain-containing protein n=1 Tax=Lithospermum erythrorhizon TaxID=34254 RepID=A0AAV3PPM0_LITER